MSGLKDLAKGGWHPKSKSGGGKESWRGDFKGVNTVAGWMGKGKDPHQEANDHVSAPLSTLRDPSSFAPPPKHKHFYGDAATTSAGSSSTHDSEAGGPLPRGEHSARERLQARQQAQLQEEEEAHKAPPGPYKVDTTGLSTAHLPKPPVFRPSQTSPVSEETTKPKPKPRLPPRLPPLQNSHPDTYSPAPPPPYSETPQNSDPAQGLLNQGAMSRLGQAGVSVPGFNIDRNASPPVPPRQNSASSHTPASPVAGGSRGPQLGELQSRFAKMSTSQHDGQAARTGTTWAEKQATLKTADSLRNDPSKVTLSDMRGAASTANNFRERHGEQAAAGWKAANGLNQKYGVADRVNDYRSPVSPPPPALTSPTQPTAGGLGKKPPPPPPPKRKNLTATTDEPPPIPLGSKPKF
ncbi:hypothetical protein K491DRAFT_712098 [Lophiostoma macrostomum CBS 122681]|uniref:Uncharacterized protein n=1 Tax=Lophiostoma macrostomum CBS 122681 TaxID=1314788 RepID=A0A6A6TL82_9PLEO|nr:hypothetical protein K491DRAFT_712098 [Lophiostoma macrostomum CBS 122681]